MSKMNSEKAQRHIDSLYQKKKHLDTRIEVCYAERVNDEIINSMKQNKVKLNDEIIKYKRMITTNSQE